MFRRLRRRKLFHDSAFEIVRNFHERDFPFDVCFGQLFKFVFVSAASANFYMLVEIVGLTAVELIVHSSAHQVARFSAVHLPRLLSCGLRPRRGSDLLPHSICIFLIFDIFIAMRSCIIPQHGLQHFSSTVKPRSDGPDWYFDKVGDFFVGIAFDVA